MADYCLGEQRMEQTDGGLLHFLYLFNVAETLDLHTGQAWHMKLTAAIWVELNVQLVLRVPGEKVSVEENIARLLLEVMPAVCVCEQ